MEGCIIFHSFKAILHNLSRNVCQYSDKIHDAHLTDTKTPHLFGSQAGFEYVVIYNEGVQKSESDLCRTCHVSVFEKMEL